MANKDKSKNNRKVTDETAPFKGMQGIISTIEKATQKKFEDEVLSKEVTGKSKVADVKKDIETPHISFDNENKMMVSKAEEVEDFSDFDVKKATNNKEVSNKGKGQGIKKSGLAYRIYFEIMTLIATFFKVGFIKLAPGTCGSLATIPFWVAFNYMLISMGYGENGLVFILSWAALVIGLYVIGSFATHVYTKENGRHDPGEVVIDEVVGQIIAFIIPTISIALIFSGKAHVFAKDFYCPFKAGAFVFLILVLPFILFRVFDIAKPSLVGWADKKLDGVKGIMLDDVFAGIFAGVTTVPFIWLFAKIFC